MELPCTDFDRRENSWEYKTFCRSCTADLEPANAENAKWNCLALNLTVVISVGSINSDVDAARPAEKLLKAPSTRA